MTGAFSLGDPARHASPRRHGGRGFTLIEMLVVMVLLGLATSLSLPAMQRWHDAVQARAQIAQVVEALRGAMFSAAARRRDVVVDARTFAAVAPASAAQVAEHATAPLPEGWQLARVVRATFMGNGLCQPGMVVLAPPSGPKLVVRIDGPECKIETITETAAAMR